MTVHVRFATGADRSTFAISSPMVPRVGQAQRHPLRDRRCELGEEVAGRPVIETPRDRDGAFAFGFVGDGSRRTEAPECSIGGTQASEERDVRFLFCLTDVAPPSVAVERGRRLALPVDQFRADRVVTISRCR
jgi:hypothetical protein